MRLVKFNRPEPPSVFPIRLDVKPDKEIYTLGEDINITITALNWSDKDVEISFTSTLQADYFIDDEYQWSADRGFGDAITYVTVPARDIYKWEFTHTSEDYKIAPGKHQIIGMLDGYNISAAQSFLVTAEIMDLPNGFVLSVATGKDTYAPGEPIDFTLTGTNNTQSEIVLEIPERRPVKYMIDQEIPDERLLVEYYDN